MSEPTLGELLRLLDERAAGPFEDFEDLVKLRNALPAIIEYVEAHEQLQVAASFIAAPRVLSAVDKSEAKLREALR